MTAPINDPQQGAGHDEWTELAAGWALYALDEVDEARFRTHLHTCPRCQQDVAAHLATASNLAYSLDGAAGPAPEMPLLLRKEAGLIGGPRGRAVRARREVLRSRWITTVAAAVAALAIGTGVGVSLSGGSSAPATQSAASSQTVKAFATGAKTTLTSSDGTSEATAAVLDGKGYLNVDGLPSVAAKGQQYVAWIAGTNGVLHAVAHFDAGRSVTVSLGSVSADVHSFGISLEKAGALPATPGTLVLQSI